MPKITIPRYAPIGGMILDFDGKDDFVIIPHHEDLNPGAQTPFTIEVWVKVAKVQPYLKNYDHSIIEKWEGALPHEARYPYVIRYLDERSPADPGGVVAARYDAGHVYEVRSDPGLSMNDGAYHHIAFVLYAIDPVNEQPNSLRLYIDGKLQKAQTQDGSTHPKNLSPIYLGRRGPYSVDPNYLCGQIGSVHIWNGALDEAQIRGSMFATLVGPVHIDGTTIDLMGSWRCNEGYGKLAFDYARGNDGALGDGQTSTEPTWVVSGLNQPPRFIPPIFPPENLLGGRKHEVRKGNG